MREVETVRAEIRKAEEKFSTAMGKYRAIFEDGGEKRKEIFRKLVGDALENELDILYAREEEATEDLGKSFLIFSEELVDCLQKI